MSLKLYYDRLSQPCRAVELFLKLTKIPYTPIRIDIMSGEHLSEDFGRINRFQKLPAVQLGHVGKTLSESVAILRYLCREYRVSDHWYPGDSYSQARVDEYLEWHHIGLRQPSYSYVWKKALDPLMGKTYPPQILKSAYRKISLACDAIENNWLKNSKYLTSDRISIADLLAATELDQLSLTDFDPEDGRPFLAAWMNRVRSETNPSYDTLLEDLSEFKRNLMMNVLGAKL